MLKTLHIENVAVIEKSDIEFNSGFTVLTGETGSGKSIIIDSIQLVLGERASRDMIRSNAKSAYVSAVLSIQSPLIDNLLNEYGIEKEEDDTILIEREFSIDGKSTCRINGRQVALSVIKAIGSQLINIHGQHNNQSLLNPETHISYLDRFAKNENIYIAYKKLYEKLNKIQKEIKEIEKNESDKEKRLDFLRFQINEIESADLIVGEEEELKEKRLVLMNSVKLAEATELAYKNLYSGEFNASSLFGEAISDLNTVLKYSKKISEIAANITDLSYNLDDYIEELRDFKDSIDFDQGNLDRIEERLDIIHRLKKKYGNSIEEILDFLDKANAELSNIELSEERLNKLIDEEKNVRLELNKASEALSESRIKSAEILNKKVIEELKFLDMEKINFQVSIVKSESFNPSGQDNVEFLISTNTGEPLKPLAKIASGGELSRIMLSIKNVLSEEEDIDTQIFDEVDSGVSGKTAQKIGIKLKQISKGRQIICITHLAQIACIADYHYLIKKEEANGRTYTKVSKLSMEGRKYELARIMGGIEITELNLKNAEELLSFSKAFNNEN